MSADPQSPFEGVAIVRHRWLFFVLVAINLAYLAAALVLCCRRIHSALELARLADQTLRLAAQAGQAAPRTPWSNITALAENPGGPLWMCILLSLFVHGPSWKKRAVPARIGVRDERLLIDGKSVGPLSAIASMSVLPTGGEARTLRLERRHRSAIELRVRDEAHVTALIQALGLSPTQQAVYYKLPPQRGDWRALVVPTRRALPALPILPKLHSSSPRGSMTALRVLPLALMVAGCAPQFQLPMTGAELIAYPPKLAGPALVTYLGQKDASPAVCNLRADGPHVGALSPDGRASLVHALSQGKVAPELWRRCVSAMLRTAPGPNAAALIDAISGDYRALLVSSDLEKSPAKQERLRAMQQLYIERQNGINGTDRVQEALFSDLRRALALHRISPVATRLGQELIEVFDLEHGLWTGRPVDVAMLDSLFAAKDEKNLQLFSDRLPTQALRDEARRRVIRLRIAASQYPEVRDHAAQVEEIVMKQGIYPLALTEHPPTRGWADAAKMPVRGVLVRQDLWQQTAKLLAYSGESPGLSVLPEVKLRQVLMMEVEGISRPVTLCGAAKSLDPTPCVMAGEVKIENPTAYLDKGGRFHFVDNIWMRDAVGLAQLSGPFTLPVSIGGKRLLSFDWPLYFARPEDLVLTGNGAGADGPALGVRVDPLGAQARVLFSVTAAGTYLAVLEGRDVPAFHVVSRGAQGYSGAAGSSGSDGSDGSECSNGGNGSNGGDGSDGGPGGNGGDIAVQVSCGGAACDDLIALLRTTIRSQGGAGGAGGPGGRGGRGGRGGSARSARTHTDDNGNTVTDDPGCSAGSDGSSGSDGASGSSGAPGSDGRVSFAVASPGRSPVDQLPGVPSATPGVGVQRPVDQNGQPAASGEQSRRPPSFSLPPSGTVRPAVKVEYPGPRKAGVALTITGSLTMVTGIGLLTGGAIENANTQSMLPPFSLNYPASNPGGPGRPYIIAGGVTLGLGTAMTVTGAILAVKYRTQFFRSGQVVGLRVPGTRLAVSPAGLHF